MAVAGACCVFVFCVCVCVCLGCGERAGRVAVWLRAAGGGGDSQAHTCATGSQRYHQLRSNQSLACFVLSGAFAMAVIVRARAHTLVRAKSERLQRTHNARACAARSMSDGAGCRRCECELLLSFWPVALSASLSRHSAKWGWSPEMPRWSSPWQRRHLGASFLFKDTGHHV